MTVMKNPAIPALNNAFLIQTVKRRPDMPASAAVLPMVPATIVNPVAGKPGFIGWPMDVTADTK